MSDTKSVTPNPVTTWPIFWKAIPIKVKLLVIGNGFTALLTAGALAFLGYLIGLSFHHNPYPPFYWFYSFWLVVCANSFIRSSLTNSLVALGYFKYYHHVNRVVVLSILGLGAIVGVILALVG